METCLRKIHDSRGETLIEVLASILIASLSVALLFTCITAAFRIKEGTKDIEEAYYDALADADAQYVDGEEGETSGPGTVLIKDANDESNTYSPSIEIYGDVGIYGSAGVYSYKKVPVS